MMAIVVKCVSTQNDSYNPYGARHRALLAHMSTPYTFCVGGWGV